MDLIQTKYKFAIIIIGFLCLFSSLASNSVSAQAYLQTFTITEYYKFTEKSENINSTHIAQHIDIPLGSDKWTITNVEFNLSNIQLERETLTIEEEGGAYEELKFGKFAYGIELNITEETTLYGVEIFGYEFGEPAKSGTEYHVQIQGYNSGTDAPNGTILAQTELNMTNIPSWYTQMFPTELNLTLGRYYLVLNATYSTPSDKSRYTWYFNPASTSLLHRAQYETSWSVQQEKTFTHKLIQKVTRSYNPEEINMSAIIDGTPYTIKNGSLPGTGILNNDSINLDISSSSFHIPIETNASVEVEFDLDYRIDLFNEFYSEVNMTVEPGLDIEWNINPYFERTSYNYSVEINFPIGWFNFQIFRNGFDVSSETEIIGNTLTIFNDTILSDSSWEIHAESPNRNLGITVQQENYEPGDILQLSVEPPTQSGNLTLFFVDSAGFEYYFENKSVSSENVFNFEIPYGILEGSHYAVIYWNNQTDAGTVIQEYNIIVPFSLTTLELVLIIVGSIMLPLAVFASVATVRRSRKKKEEIRQKIINKFQDVSHLEHIIIADKRTGLDIYDESISGKSMSASLITGFLEAIRSFGIELTNSEKESQTIKLEYQDSKILMSEFKNLRTTLIMSDTPSQDFVNSVKNLSEEIERKYHNQLENFRGKTTEFQSIKYSIAKYLNTSLIFPLKLNLNRKTRLTSGQKSVIQRIKSIMRQNSSDYFYVAQLFSEKKGFQTGWGVSILKLIEKGILVRKK